MKKYGIIILMTLFMILPIEVNALTGSVKISCSPNSISEKETVECLITGTTDENVKSISGNIEISDNLSISSFKVNEKWIQNSNENDKININTSDDISGDFEIGTISIKVSDNAQAGNESIKLTSVIFKDKDEEEFTVSNATTNLEIKSSSKGLSNMTVENGTLSPIFKTDINDYSVTINSNKFSLNIVAANSDDKITITEGEMGASLKANDIIFEPNEQGMMLINIKVGSGKNAVNYVLIVRKENNNSESTYDNSLASLTVGGKTVKLTKDKYDYEVTLSSNIGYKVKATLSDPENFVFDEFNNGNGTFSGDDFIITINPKDSSSGYESITYRVVIKTSSSNNNTPSGSNENHDEVSGNPQTSDIPMFLMAIILISSLIISLSLYKKNMTGYN